MEQSLKETQDQKKKKFLLKYGDIIKNEKDTYVFTHAWLNCLVQRHMWHLNWYVNIPAGHLLYEQWYGDRIDSEDESKFSEQYLKAQSALRSISVHWWLTFADHQGWVDIEWKEYDYLLWFDTAHFNDAFISSSWHIFYREWSEYRDAEYVIAETKRLAEQIAEIK